MRTRNGLLLLCGTATALPFNVVKPGIAVLGALSAHLYGTEGDLGKGPSLDSPESLRSPPGPFYRQEGPVQELNTASHHAGSNVFEARKHEIEPQFAARLRWLLHHSSILERVDLDHLVSRMRAIDDALDFAFDWEHIVYHPSFFLEFVHGKCLCMLTEETGDLAEGIKADLQAIHLEIGQAEFPGHPHFVLELPHTFGTLRDRPLFHSPDVLVSPKQLISGIGKLVGNFKAEGVDLEEMVSRMQATNQKFHFAFDWLHILEYPAAFCHFLRDESGTGVELRELQRQVLVVHEAIAKQRAWKELTHWKTWE
ncbi:MAG: hypothetical protein SGCHY_005391 [Lobulomycetales sp.]